MFSLNIFTEHGTYKNVPDVRRMSIAEAIQRLESAGFKWEITDSTYNDSYPLGSIIEQDPKPNAQAKSLRTIYLSVNASSPRLVAIPTLNDMSLRQGESILQGLGFKNINIVYQASPYKDLILSVTVNGRQMENGTKAQLSAQITIMVGNGDEEMTESDSLKNSTEDTDFINDFENNGQF